jgi:von Hippel-Lindau disease tumor supressor
MKRMILSFVILIMLSTAFSQVHSSSLIEPEIPASDSKCENESRLRSIEGVKAVEFTLSNRSKTTIVLYWLNYEGKRVQYETVEPGMQVKQPTFLTHPWVVTDTKGRCIRILTPPGDFVIQ